MAGPVLAGGAYDVERAVRASLPHMPAVSYGPFAVDTCDGANANPVARYCTSERRIHLSGRPRDVQTAYALAHLMGHAALVEHGIADIAWRSIRARPHEEQALRRMVTQQVECLAGVFMARAEVDIDPVIKSFTSEPFVGSHWGRRPLNRGPKVAIGLELRVNALRRGFDASAFSVCSYQEITPDLLLEQEIWPSP